MSMIFRITKYEIIKEKRNKNKENFSKFTFHLHTNMHLHQTSITHSL